MRILNLVDIDCASTYHKMTTTFTATELEKLMSLGPDDQKEYVSFINMCTSLKKNKFGKKFIQNTGQAQASKCVLAPPVLKQTPAPVFGQFLVQAPVQKATSSKAPAQKASSSKAPVQQTSPSKPVIRNAALGVRAQPVPDYSNTEASDTEDYNDIYGPPSENEDTESDDSDWDDAYTTTQVGKKRKVAPKTKSKRKPTWVRAKPDICVADGCTTKPSFHAIGSNHVKWCTIHASADKRSTNDGGLPKRFRERKRQKTR